MRNLIQAQSPMRISFAGGGTDIADWYERYGGAVLSCTIDKSACVALRPRDDSRVRLRSLDLGVAVDYRLGDVPAYDGTLDMAKAAAARFEIGRGFDLEMRSDAPPGSGLGGSAALAAALVGALAAHAGVRLGRREVAETSYAIERDDLAIPGGKQDQYATTFGGFNHIVFGAGGVEVEPAGVGGDVLRDLETRLLLCHLGQNRPDLGIVDAHIGFLRSGRRATIDGMRSMRADLARMKDALARKDLNLFGTHLHQSFVHKKMMNPLVTKDTVAEELYEAALASGALGGKLAGAGGGGYLLLYVPASAQGSVRRALEAASCGAGGEAKGGGVAKVAFTNRGLHVRTAARP